LEQLIERSPTGRRVLEGIKSMSAIIDPVAAEIFKSEERVGSAFAPEFGGVLNFN
jgi:hypothetical protein